jgi:hypothetical protein
MSIDTFQRESLGPSFLMDVQYGIGNSHRAYPLLAENPTYLSPFAMWTAFPSADYYGDSVPMRLAPVRESRVSYVVDVQVGLGALFVSLRSLEATLFPRSVFLAGPTTTKGEETTDVSRCIRDQRFR